MFDFDAGKIIIVGVAALIFIPPKDLPRVLRQVGQFVGKMRRMAAEFQGQFMDAMREADMDDLRREAQKLSDAARVSTGLDTMHALNRDLTGALDRTGTSDPSRLPAETPPAADVPTSTTELPESARSSQVANEPAAPPQEAAPGVAATPEVGETALRRAADAVGSHSV